VHTGAGLGRLDELAGVRTLHPFGITRCGGRLGGRDIDVAWYCYALAPAAAGCEVLGEYVDGPAAGKAWAVRRKVGDGQIVLLAAHAPDNYAAVLETALKDIELTRYESSWGTTIVPREGGGRRAYIIANWDGAGGTATLPEGGRDLVSGDHLAPGNVELEPFAVRAIVCE